MKKGITVVTLATLIALTGAYQASANWGHGGGMGGGGGCQGQGIALRADLDDATKAEYENFVESTQDLRKEIFVKRAEIRALMNAEEPNAEKVGTLSGELFDLRATMLAKAKEAGLSDVVGAGKGPGCGDCEGRGGYHHGRKGMMGGGQPTTTE